MKFNSFVNISTKQAKLIKLTEKKRENLLQKPDPTEVFINHELLQIYISIASLQLWRIIMRKRPGYNPSFAKYKYLKILMYLNYLYRLKFVFNNEKINPLIGLLQDIMKLMVSFHCKSSFCSQNCKTKHKKHGGKILWKNNKNYF